MCSGSPWNHSRASQTLEATTVALPLAKETLRASLPQSGQTKIQSVSFKTQGQTAPGLLSEWHCVCSCYAHRTQEKPKHDRDLPASPCSRFVTSSHLISHRHVNVRSTSGARGLRHLGLSFESPLPSGSSFENRMARSDLCLADRRPTTRSRHFSPHPPSKLKRDSLHEALADEIKRLYLPHGQ